LRAALESLGRVAAHLPVVFPIHPRTRARAQQFGLEALLAPLRILDPLGYSEMLGLIDGAAVVLTDSGGLQEETTALGIPCITLREQTERPVTVTHGTNRLAGWPLEPESVEKLTLEALAKGRADGGARPEGWDGRAAERIVSELVS
jgi:UDP-N-acetylglucosamine 2-epimerase (non-hydrolysing)